VREHRLGDLLAHAVHRVQAGEGVLEDHRDVAAAHPAQVAGVEPEHVRALEQDLAGDGGGRGVEQAHDREARDALPRARLADDAERLAAAEREREVGDRLDDAVAGAELDGEVADV
jgi:hypothetical protein